MSGDARSPAGTRTRKVSPARMEKYRAEREAIMRAAYELIQRNGSKETSVHDVLRETGYSTRAFYRHFRSKDELVIEMYRVDSDRVSEALAAAVAAAPSPLDGLEAWIDQNLAVVYDARRLRHAVVLSSPEVASAEGYAAVQLAGLDAQRAPLVALLRQGQEDGAFPFAEPEADAVAIQAVVGAHVRTRLQHADGLTRSEARAHTVALFRRALGA